MAKKRRGSNMDPRARRRGYRDVDHMIRHELTEKKRTIPEIAADLDCLTSHVHRRIGAHLPDLIGVDNLDHRAIVKAYQAGTNRKALAKSYGIRENRIRDILVKWEETTGEKVIRPRGWHKRGKAGASKPKPASTQWNKTAATATRKPGRDVDADHSGPPLSQQLADLDAAERQATLDAWRDARQEALDAVATLGRGSRARRYAVLEAAAHAARLKIAQTLTTA